jgi:peptide chain release factor subunit 1
MPFSGSRHMTSEGGSQFRKAVPVSSLDLRELAEIYSEKDVFLSLYLPTATRSDRNLNESYVRQREKLIGKAIGKDLLECFGPTMDQVKEIVERNPVEGEKGLVVFASRCSGFLREYRISVEPERKMVLDTSPFLLPLARLKDEYEDYGLLLMDSREARLMVVRSSILEKEGSSSIDLMNRHKKGGMSQMRFNRLRRGAIKSFVLEVVEDLRNMEDLKNFRGLVIAGPGEAKKLLVDELPLDISELIIGSLDVDMDTPSDELISLSDEMAAQDERREEQDLVKSLEAAVMKNEPAAYGEVEIKESLEQGRVGVLLILKGTTIPGWICERCQNLNARTTPPENCPVCEGPTSQVEFVEELYELAQRSGAEVEFVEESPFLESIGGIGALLRY